ncbi:acetyl esterase/lipase [Oxalobacteraceae bacterium GrIS 1.11]
MRYRHGVLLVLASWAIGAQAQPQAGPQAEPQADSETLALWAGAPPDGPGPQGAERRGKNDSLSNIAQSYMIVHRCARANGAAVLLISGGGYAHIELGKESTPAALWLQSRGWCAFELVYRLPQEGWGSSEVPFQDAQRAMRLIRSRAAEFGVDPKRIGVLGFSAGAHLAGMTAAAPGQARYRPTDAVDRLSARPDFAALIYPVLTMLAPFDQTHARKSILGAAPTPERAAAYSVERRVDHAMPPTFLAQALDDPIAPVDNSLLMLRALRLAEVPVEAHIFQSGGHGWGMATHNAPAQAWPELFLGWAVRNGF